MKSKWVSCTLVLFIFLVLGAGGARANNTAFTEPQAPLGQAFTYQGQLKDSSGDPINDSCDFLYKLYDAETDGTQVGPNQEQTGVVLEDGYFTVVLDFGSNAFLGEARWMEIAVKCSGDADYTILAPRQALTAAPYSVDADLLDGQHAVAFSSASHTHWGQTWTGSGIGLTLSGGTSGISGSGSTYGVYGTSPSTSGTGVSGYTNSTTGNTCGVQGISDSDTGVGVFGYAQSSTGGTTGVLGQTISPYGTGVLGWVGGYTGPTIGIHGVSLSNNGIGVEGNAFSTTGYTWGVTGRSDSSLGTGVDGLASSTTGYTYGVSGESDSSSGTGVYGYAPSTSGNTFGVSGLSASPVGTGVYGYASSISGYNFGVYGRTDSDNGTGIYGYSSSVAGPTSGVKGSTDSISGYGVFGLADNNSGINSTGVYGRGDGDDSFGVAGHAYYSGVGVGAWSYSGNLIEAYSGDFPTGTLQFYISGAGNVFANGNYYTFSTSSVDGETYATTSIQSTETWLEDFGRGELVDGIATISIASDFTGMTNLSLEYMVFVTLEGDCQGVYVTDKTPTSFVVHELNGGTSNVPFGYRIVAKPAGAETERLPELTIPATVDVERTQDETTQPPTPVQPQQSPDDLELGQLPN